MEGAVGIEPTHVPACLLTPERRVSCSRHHLSAVTTLAACTRGCAAGAPPAKVAATTMVVGMAAAWAGNRSVGFSLSAVDTMRMLLIVISAAGSVRRELLLAGACVTLRRHGFICAAASSRTPQQERPSQQHKAPQAGAATGCLPARAARLSLPTSPKHHELAVLWRCHKAASFVIAFPSGLSRAQVLYAKNAHGFLDVAWRPPAPTTLRTTRTGRLAIFPRRSLLCLAVVRSCSLLPVSLSCQIRFQSLNPNIVATPLSRLSKMLPNTVATPSLTTLSSLG